MSLALLAATLAAPAAASPPPLPVAVTLLVYAPDGHPSITQAETLRQRLIADGWFSDTPSELGRPALERCFGDRDTEDCLRVAMAPVRRKSPPEVVVLVSRDPAGKAPFRCLGPGLQDHNRERQDVMVDVAAAIDADPDRGRADRQAAAACIISAAAESGW